MPHSLRRRVFGALAGASLVAGFAGTPAVAHADASLTAVPGAAEAVVRPGMCFFWGCWATFDFVMAPPDGTLVVDWGDGTTDTYTPGTAEFEVLHNFAPWATGGAPMWTITMSVNGGPATYTFVACTPPVDTGVCE